MQFQTEAYEDSLVPLLVDIIGHRLSKDSLGRPNVIVAYPSDNSNDKGIKPNQPFITVQVQSVTTPYGWLLDKYIDDQDRTLYVVAVQINCIISAYGKGSHDIISELKQRLEFDVNRDSFNESTGSVLISTGNLPNNYDYLNTDFEQFTPLVITAGMNSIIIDPDGGIIERVDLTGELKYSDSDNNPEITLHIEAP